MPKHIALLRGVNVAGKNKIKMADLRERLDSASLKNVVTYIQSGNIIFDSTAASSSLEKKIAKIIKSDFGYEVPVLVFKRQRLQKLVKANPFSENPIEHVAVTLLSKKPDKQHVAAIENLDFGDDHFQITGDNIFLNCPNGFGRTKLTNNFFEQKLKTAATTRNWKTINKLFELSS